ncbi:MAG: hypothetical protein M3Y07_13030 [Acidobacteriota bacterium]|nr:hypothetical protein [Acidobacteriota bacterium]
MGAATAPVPPLKALPGDSGPIKLSVATYSLRNFKRPEAIKMIQQLQIKFADIKDVHLPLTNSPAELRQGTKEFQDAGIKIVACGNIRLREPDEQRHAFEYEGVRLADHRMRSDAGNAARDRETRPGIQYQDRDS